MPEQSYCVYIMASKSRVIYIGITNNLCRRAWEHKHDVLPGFTREYKCHRLLRKKL
jgi:putative endonuclease